MKGRQVRTLDRLLKLGGKSVWVSRWSRPCSVAFLISMQVRTANMFLQAGIFEYKAKGTKQA